MTNAEMAAGRIRLAALAKKLIRPSFVLDVARGSAMKPHQHGIVGCFQPVVFGPLGFPDTVWLDDWVATLYGRVDIHRERLDSVWAQYGLFESIDLTRYVCKA